eukprot:CAMPEP_0203767078 /NCGR_PEP_ID=MMETSP0099_2-20121227/788_1 /ASSEMBLY_ACC=CAM_ASM_000209 /TAXON_ID=96639 /ORGANISM=" , Strain NY0313808BC1" /LENGTH=356 /DNA_ID=CAMNT_0050663529 /DNA_START=234 /DNA_END=1301 /DNA_ORIENTATION=-
MAEDGIEVQEDNVAGSILEKKVDSDLVGEDADKKDVAKDDPVNPQSGEKKKGVTLASNHHGGGIRQGRDQDRGVGRPIGEIVREVLVVEEIWILLQGATRQGVLAPHQDMVDVATMRTAVRENVTKKCVKGIGPAQIATQTVFVAVLHVFDVERPSLGQRLFRSMVVIGHVRLAMQMYSHVEMNVSNVVLPDQCLVDKMVGMGRQPPYMGTPYGMPYMPQQMPPQGNTRPGDWTCPECRANVFASRNECYKCRTPKPPGAGESQPPYSGHTPYNGGYHVPPMGQGPPNGFRAGDWLCPSPQCSAHNYASRTTCFRCNGPRGPPAPMGGGGYPPQQFAPYGGNQYQRRPPAERPGDW